MDFLGALFRIPIGLVNVVLAGAVADGETIRLYQPKEFYDHATKEELSLDDLLGRGFMFAYNKRDYINMKVDVVNNSAEDICNLALELEELTRNQSAISFAPEVLRILESNGIENRSLSKISRSWLNHHPDFIAVKKT